MRTIKKKGPILDMRKIPVIDLFAGAGGLAEGFSSVTRKGERLFQIGLSVEKDTAAHKTLELRSFLRQFPINEIPEAYYKAVCESNIIIREQNISSLFKEYPEQYKNAQKEAFLHELGTDSSKAIDERISQTLNGYANWVLIGGPPCQAFSLAGRSRVGGISAEDHRVYLYEEYLRVIAKFEPAVFVMENVKGLLSAKVNEVSVFNMILEDLKEPYKIFEMESGAEYTIHSLVSENIESPTDYLIKSEDYGIPQKRHRVILLGVRNDIDLIPEKLLKRKSHVSIDSVVEDLPIIRSKLNRQFSHYEGVEKKRKYRSVQDSSEIWQKTAIDHLAQLSKLYGFQNYGLNFKFQQLSTGSEYIEESVAGVADKSLQMWYKDSNLKGVLNHVSRSHLVDDLMRYLFAAIYSDKYSTSPKLTDYKNFSAKLLPDHRSADSGKFADRFRVQVKGYPATTITSHISKDGHYFIHYDPEQNRSLTVREAARIQSFPDNFLFRGSRTQQFHQAGNAVPPYLAFQIGHIVTKLLSHV